MKFRENDRTGRVALVLLLIAVGAFGALLLLDLLTIGPGYPPPEALQKWYIPQPRYEYAENGTVVVNRTIGGGIVLLGDIEEGCPSLFPDCSRYCSHAVYLDTVLGDRYLVVNWYFDDDADLARAEGNLCSYLRSSGNVASAGLILPGEPDRSPDAPIVSPITVTKYESETSSGYFGVVEKPLSPEHDDYFIVYYGVFGPAVLPDHTAALEELMLRSYSLRNARPLASCT
ncbi:MAG: hypothetical protein XD82_0839 [Methanoculleus marisnigri]|jgi:hypothetical protein|uniref:Methanolan biosynthesis EpsI domain-containing protein n=1 Tax=Methanoculleus marisnigri TaxID=2198 RepID=A0A101GP33_9EURY|nr:hypothetical protein [Methanoculleus marisnigri]KUK62028.1 MAG: hypothetical protein XD82_0839 [Methanoculleus marisnigri]